VLNIAVRLRGLCGDDLGRRERLKQLPPFPGAFWTGRRRAGEPKTVQRSQVKLATLAVVLIQASVGWGAGPNATSGSIPGAVVSGIVRDAQGVAQMGALIQVMSNNSVTAATAFTDLHGRYVINNLIPGKYYVKASAALFVPATRENLTLHSGARTVVNLTLSTLFEATSWIPAERRKADEPGDDWKWTLRSAANRPILRMVEDGEIVLVSSSATESGKPYESGKNVVTAGDGDFGQGGVHNTLSFDRGLMDGADVRLRMDVGSGLSQGTPPVGRPSIEVQAGYQRQMGFAGASRVLTSFQSHPELMGTGHVMGLDAMQIATAQKTQFGDFGELEAGGALVVVRTSGSTTTARPFVRMSVHPAKDWTVGYRIATARDMQGFNSLDAVQPELPVAVTLPNGHVSLERGLHQEFSVSRKAGKGVIQASYYRDNLSNVLVAGGGRLSSGDVDGRSPMTAPAFGVLTDTITGGFKLLSEGYQSQGFNVILSEPLTAGMWAAVQIENGTALAMRGPGTLTLVGAESALKPMAGQSATFSLKGTVLHSRTAVRASYRWQPQYLVTAVDPYAAFSDQAFLSFYVRQPITFSWLPSGLAATVDVTNLLEQGYRPFISADGRTLYLAQVPRSLQAGLAFNF
jgi:Carboxypeptidase regulatory-like domain